MSREDGRVPIQIDRFLYLEPDSPENISLLQTRLRVRDIDDVPNIDSSQITSGVLDSNRIPNLDAKRY